VPDWLLWGLIALLVLAALQDAARLKISNYLSGAVLILGVVAAIVAGPRLSLWENGLVFVLALAIGTFLFGRGILGGGDVNCSRPP
jgi:prepilin peptidase CpaA